MRCVEDTDDNNDNEVGDGKEDWELDAPNPTFFVKTPGRGRTFG